MIFWFYNFILNNNFIYYIILYYIMLYYIVLKCYKFYKNCSIIDVWWSLKYISLLLHYAVLQRLCPILFDIRLNLESSKIWQESFNLNLNKQSCCFKCKSVISEVNFAIPIFFLTRYILYPKTFMYITHLPQATSFSLQDRWRF